MKMLVKKEKQIFHIFSTLLFVFTVVFSITGCSSHEPLTLMPTPVLYQDSTIDPFAHLPPTHKSTSTHVYYATNRAPKFLERGVDYGNTVDSAIHLGKATVRFGTSDTDWSDLRNYSLTDDPNEFTPLTIEKLDEMATMSSKDRSSGISMTPELKVFIDSINSDLSEAVDKEIMVYIHGTKVDFTNANILTAEIDHFAGRDFVGLAFAWPSHQNILSYLFGFDVRRALNSSLPLQNLLVLLSEYTTAEHINILSYSAGGKVGSKALFDLRQAFPELESKELKEKFRIGSVVFAAADVEVDKFLDRLPAIHDLADQVVITVTDDDYALKAAKKYMGGKDRTGSIEAEKKEEAFIVSHHLANVEIIDVSLEKDVRGFDIVGHHYWYRHPWMSSDIIFLMRTDLPPHRRGLTPAELEGIWYLSPDYPEKIREAAEVELEGQW